MLAFFFFTKRELPSLLSRGRGWHGTRKREKKRGKRPRDIPGPGKRSCIPRFPVPERSRPAMGSTTIPLSPFSLLRSTPLHLLHLRGPCISRRQRGHFYPPRSLPPAPLPFSFRRLPSPLGTPSSQPAFPSPASSLITLGGLNAFITRPFSLQTFGIGAEGGGPESASGGGVEIRERGKRRPRREEGERKMDRRDRVCGCDGVGREREREGGRGRNVPASQGRLDEGCRTNEGTTRERARTMKSDTVESSSRYSLPLSRARARARARSASLWNRQCRFTTRRAYSSLTRSCGAAATGRKRGRSGGCECNGNYLYERSTITPRARARYIVIWGDMRREGVGETGRSLSTRTSESTRSFKNSGRGESSGERNFLPRREDDSSSGYHDGPQEDRRRRKNRVSRQG